MSTIDNSIPESLGSRASQPEDNLSRTSPNAKSIYKESKLGAFFTKTSAFLAGAAGGLAVLQATTGMALLGVIGPIGWAALGCLGVGLAIIATYNYLEENPNVLQSFKDAAKDIGKWALIGFFTPIVILGFFLTGGLANCTGVGGASPEINNDGNTPPNQPPIITAENIE